MNSVWMVFDVSVEGAMLGYVHKYDVCATKELAEEKLIEYLYSVDPTRENYRYGRLNGVEGFYSWEEFTFLYIEEKGLINE